MEHVLEVRDLILKVKDEDNYYKALNNVSFDINKGEVIGIVGESGCGKSLTSLSIMNLLPSSCKIESGSIKLNDIDLLKCDENKLNNIRGKDMSMIFQEPMTALNPLYCVGKQIEEAYLIHNKCSKKESYKETIEIMRKVGLSRPEKLYYDYPHQLSGGMRQRIVIAMALINKPSLIIADEPTTALDVTIQYQILLLLKKLNKEYGCSIMMISHDLGVISEICSKIDVMYSGYVVEEGKTEEILNEPLHPYTKGLIKSIPTPNMKDKALYTIKGMVMPLDKRSEKGCPYADRCDCASKKCFEEVPELQELSNNRKVRCFNL